jgi:hypothetical protein
VPRVSAPLQNDMSSPATGFRVASGGDRGGCGRQQRHQPPYFIKGSSLGATAAYCAYAASDVFAGAVLMGFMIPSSPLIPTENPFRTTAWEQMSAMFGRALEFNIGRYIDFDVDYGFDGAAEQKRRDPLNTSTYDLAAIASILRYDPAVALADNTKPFLFQSGRTIQSSPWTWPAA